MKKVLQPAGLIPGALLVLLNLALVVPRAGDEKVGIATAYSGLTEPQQVIVATALALIIGFLLLSASGAILDTLAGRTWRLGLLSSVLRALRNWHRARLDARIQRVMDEGPSQDIQRLDELLWRRRTRMAPAGRSSAPTALGDVLLAFDEGIMGRYGVRLAALWEPLRASVDKDDAAVAAAGESKATLDLLANLTFALALFVAEVVVTYTLFHDPRGVLHALFGLPLAYVAYRLTVAKAISWCDAIDTTVALHAATLLEKLGIRKPLGGSDRRELLTKAGEFMLIPEPDDSLLGAAPAPAPVVTASPNLDVVSHERAFEQPADTAVAGEALVFDLFVTCTKATAPWSAAGTFLFEDARVPRIRQQPTDAQGLLRGTNRETGDALRFDVSLTGDSAATLAFQLDTWRVAVDGGLTVRVQRLTGDDTRIVTVANPTGAAVAATLAIFHTEVGATYELVPGSGLGAVAVPDGSLDKRFSINVPANGKVKVSYALKELP